MSSAVLFLETMGRSASLRYAAKAALYNALTEHQVEPDMQWAILRGDVSRLERLLCAPTGLVCAIALPDADAAESAEAAICWTDSG